MKDSRRFKQTRNIVFFLGDLMMTALETDRNYLAMAIPVCASPVLVSICIFCALRNENALG